MRSWDLEKLVIALDAEALTLSPQAVGERSLGSVLSEIVFHSECRYWQFTPTYTSSFKDRLAKWLSNAILEPEDVKTMLRSILHLQFVDRDDLMALYQAAFAGPIQRWLMDQSNLTFGDDPSLFDSQLSKSVSETWFCPVTDSMDIAQFCHINRIAGADYRPPWRVLSKFGNKETVSEYLARKGLKRVVILEDFVGSGTQSAGPIFRAAEMLGPSVPILFTPLIASQVGIKSITAKLPAYPTITFDPVFRLPLGVQLRQTPVPGEPPLFTELRKTVERTFEAVRLPGPTESKQLEKPFGYGDVGSLLVLYTNCPNNTLPLFWHLAPDWEPLFHRISRS